jgi:hypothetical protein
MDIRILKIFIKKTTLIMTNIFIYLIIRLHSKSFERIMRDIDTKNRTLFSVLNKALAFQMRYCHSRNVWSLAFLICSYLNTTFKTCSIVFYQPFLHLLVEGLNTHTHLLLFNILKCSFCPKIHHS